MYIRDIQLDGDVDGVLSTSTMPIPLAGQNPSKTHPERWAEMNKLQQCRSCRKNIFFTTSLWVF